MKHSQTAKLSIAGVPTAAKSKKKAALVAKPIRSKGKAGPVVSVLVTALAQVRSERQQDNNKKKKAKSPHHPL